MTIDAVLSANRKYAICGSCGRSLCRRNRLAFDGFLRRPDERRYYHDLLWDVDWHLVRDHLERSSSGLERLALGRPPVRRGFSPKDPPESGRGFPERPPALCPWCGTLNQINPKRLDIVRP